MRRQELLDSNVLKSRSDKLQICGLMRLQDGGGVMNWQPTYHLYFPDMEVCEPDEHSRLEVYRLSIMGWMATAKYLDMSNVWACGFHHVGRCEGCGREVAGGPDRGAGCVDSWASVGDIESADDSCDGRWVFLCFT